MVVDDLAAPFDPLDQVRLDLLAVIGDGRVGGGHLERADRLGAEAIDGTGLSGESMPRRCAISTDCSGPTATDTWAYTVLVEL